MRRSWLAFAVLPLGLLAACHTGLRGPVDAPLAVAAPAPAVESTGDEIPDFSAFEAGPAVPRTARPSKRTTFLERTAADGRRVRPGAEKAPRRAWFVLTPEHPSAPN